MSTRETIDQITVLLKQVDDLYQTVPRPIQNEINEYHSDYYGLTHLIGWAFHNADEINIDNEFWQKLEENYQEV